jgi:FKBP-type peptidyl-prolyl cis-trans isomerase
LALAGCGGSGSSSGAKTTPKETKPTVIAPKGPPPKKLVVKEIKEGTGKPVKRGDQVTVRWAGFLYKGGKEFYSTWKDHDTFTFLTDAGRVIPGWDRGMIGMKAGGRRELIIPPTLAYGAEGRPLIPPNETLIYVVDLLAIG